MALQKTKQDKLLNFRTSPAFKEALERATKKANVSTVTEFIKQAIIEKAERLEIKIDRYK